jgi:hypothetical protein
VTLKLEYNCTEAEMQEAKTLQEREHYGRGSKWRARLVLGGLLALTLAGTYLRFKTEVAPRDRPWFMALVVAVVLAVLVFKRITRRKIGGQVRIEV